MSLIDTLSAELGISASQCRLFLEDASRKYKTYTIPKRNGGRRLIAQPSKELKEFQRAFIKLYQFPVHKCVTGYVKGCSIRENAERHSRNPYLLKTDINNFFNSIKPSVFWEVLEDVFQKGKWISKKFHDDLVNDKKYVNELLFWRPGKNSKQLILSIGAPSSPVISNFCMFGFDEEISDICRRQDIIYSRYADDLTFSSKNANVLPKFIKVVRSKLNDSFSGILILNQQKTILTSKARKRQITGIIITNDQKLSIGRDKKRYVKHQVHQFILRNLSEEEVRSLQGYLSFVKHIEPLFIESLRKKYSNADLSALI